MKAFNEIIMKNKNDTMIKANKKSDQKTPINYNNFTNESAFSNNKFIKEVENTNNDLTNKMNISVDSENGIINIKINPNNANKNYNYHNRNSEDELIKENSSMFNQLDKILILFTNYNEFIQKNDLNHSHSKYIMNIKIDININLCYEIFKLEEYLKINYNNDNKSNNSDNDNNNRRISNYLINAIILYYQGILFIKEIIYSDLLFISKKNIKFNFINNTSSTGYIALMNDTFNEDYFNTKDKILFMKKYSEYIQNHSNLFNFEETINNSKLDINSLSIQLNFGYFDNIIFDIISSFNSLSAKNINLIISEFTFDSNNEENNDIYKNLRILNLQVIEKMLKLVNKRTNKILVIEILINNANVFDDQKSLCRNEEIAYDCIQNHIPPLYYDVIEIIITENKRLFKLKLNKKCINNFNIVSSKKILKLNHLNSSHSNNRSNQDNIIELPESNYSLSDLLLNSYFSCNINTCGIQLKDIFIAHPKLEKLMLFNISKISFTEEISNTLLEYSNNLRILELHFNNTNDNNNIINCTNLNDLSLIKTIKNFLIFLASRRNFKKLVFLKINTNIKLYDKINIENKSTRLSNKLKNTNDDLIDKKEVLMFMKYLMSILTIIKCKVAYFNLVFNDEVNNQIEDKVNNLSYFECQSIKNSDNDDKIINNSDYVRLYSLLDNENDIKIYSHLYLTEDVDRDSKDNRGNINDRISNRNYYQVNNFIDSSILNLDDKKNKSLQFICHKIDIQVSNASRVNDKYNNKTDQKITDTIKIPDKIYFYNLNNFYAIVYCLTNLNKSYILRNLDSNYKITDIPLLNKKSIIRSKIFKNNILLHIMKFYISKEKRSLFITLT